MKNTTEENYPAAPEGYVCLGKGKTFKKNSHFLALPKYEDGKFLSDEPYWCDGESERLIYYVPIDSEIAKLNGLGKINYPPTPEGYVCLGMGGSFKTENLFYGISCYHDGSVMDSKKVLYSGENTSLIYYAPIDSEIAKLNGLGENKMETKQEKEEIKVGDKVIFKDYGFPNPLVFKVFAADKHKCWIETEDGKNYHIKHFSDLVKYKEPIKVGSKVKQKGTSVIYHNDIGDALYIHNEHALVLWHGDKVPNLKRMEDLEVIP